MKSYLQEILNVVDRRTLIALCAISLFLTLLEAVSISAIIPAISIIVGGNLPPFITELLQSLNITSTSDQILIVIGAVATIFVGRGVVLTVIVYLQSKLVFSIQEKLSNRLLGRYMSARFDSLTDVATSTLVRTSTAELANITHGILLSLSTLISELALVFGSLLVLFSLKPIAAIVLVAAMITFATPIYLLNRARLGKLGRIRHDMEDNRVKLAQELVSGFREVKVYGLEDSLRETIRRTNKEYARVLAQSNFLQNFPRIYFETLGVAALLLICAFQFYHGTPIAEIIMFLTISAFAAFRALPSVAKLLAQLQSIRFFRPSLISYLELLDVFIPEKAVNKPTVENMSITAAHPIRILITQAAYRHKPGSKDVFSNVSFQIESGQLVGLVGASGVGKSTLLDCLIGLRKPTAGTIKTLDQETGLSVVPRISYVPQTPVMLDASILRNITLSQIDAPELPISDSRFNEALEISGFAETMKFRQLNMHSKVVEGGRNLSGGQRQRLALTRALNRNADIIVLDEATSALDNSAEEAIMERLRTRCSTQLVIMVTHKPELLKYCDLIINMETGGTMSLVSSPRSGA